MSRASLLAFATALALTATAGSAAATFPGQNGKIAFTQGPPGEEGEIVVMDPNGQGQVPLTDSGASEINPSFSADGERIAFARAAALNSDIWVMSADGAGQSQLTSGPEYDVQPAFSPDGQRIVFQRSGGASGADPEIFVMDANGQNATQLTNNTAFDGNPSFSPDGQRIVFVFDDGPDSEIRVMEADGQDPISLTTAADDSEPSWSPDGQRILFERAMGAGEIFVMDADGQNQAPLTQTAAPEEGPVFSPDALKIAFSGFGLEIAVMDADGQNQTPLTDNTLLDINPDWQPLNPPALDLSGAPKQKSAKFVTLTVTSANENASVELAGTVTAKKTPKGSPAAAKAKTFALVPQSIELQPAQPVTVQLAIPKKARKLLKSGFAAGKKGKATIAATAADDLGASSQDDQQVKIKKTKKKK